MRLPSSPRDVAFFGSAIAVVSLVGILVAPSADRVVPPAPVQSAVGSTEFVCGFLVGGGTLTTTVGLLAPSDVPQGDSKVGAATARVLGSPKTTNALVRVGSPGRQVVKVLNKNTSPLVTTGTGTLAPGLTGELTTTAPSGIRRGLASSACPTPATDQWFVGGASAVGRTSELQLINTEATAATVDLDIYSQKGRVSSPAALGIVVAAHSQRTLPFDELAPGAGELSIHARVETGRLAMLVRDVSFNGQIPLGLDFVPRVVAPSRHLVVPGLVKVTENRAIWVVAPGNSDAHLSLRVLGLDGDFAPAGLEDVTVEAGTVKRIDLTKALGDEPAAIDVSSDVPVTASGWMRNYTPGFQTRAEFAWTGAIDPLTGPAYSSLVRLGPKSGAQIALTAGPRDAKVRLDVMANGKKTVSRTLSIPAMSTRVTTIGLATDTGLRSVAIVPLEDSGPVYAVRIATTAKASGSMITAVPLRDARITVAVPTTYMDESVGLSRRDAGPDAG